MAVTEADARAKLVAEALSFDGAYNGHGYDCSNRFSTDLGRAAEAWCDDYYTDVNRLAGYPLPSCQPGETTGSSYVPDFWGYARRHHATKSSWEAQPGDAVIFHWPGGNPDGDHIERVVYWRDGVLRTIGGNSGPSNVNGYRGVGGVHQHDWSCPHGVGNSDIVGIIDVAKIVDLGADTVQIPAHAKQTGPRPLSLKTPHLKGPDVKHLQARLNHETPHLTQLVEDSVFGPAVRARLIDVQHRFQDPYGVAAAHTREFLHIKS